MRGLRRRGNAVVDLDVVVVGAGFSGIYAVHAFRSAGLTVKAFEAGDGIGGTWFWNSYPGARCDVESKDYSYSFSPELEQEWSWSERYPVDRDNFGRGVGDGAVLRVGGRVPL
jgi:cation diffusion facilitator CzcD-associated flavoprotein CzcO